MGLFGSKQSGFTVTENQFSWKTNKISIKNGYFVSEIKNHEL